MKDAFVRFAAATASAVVVFCASLFVAATSDTDAYLVCQGRRFDVHTEEVVSKTKSDSLLVKLKGILSLEIHGSTAQRAVFVCRSNERFELPDGALVTMVVRNRGAERDVFFERMSGVLHGPFVEANRDGRRTRFGAFVDGEKDGWWQEGGKLFYFEGGVRVDAETTAEMKRARAQRLAPPAAQNAVAPRQAEVQPRTSEATCGGRALHEWNAVVDDTEIGTLARKRLARCKALLEEPSSL